MSKIKIKIPGLGFIAVFLALIFSIISLVFYINTYAIEPFPIDRWSIMFTAFSIWCLAFLLINMLFKGDRPFWCIIIYALTAFMLIYSLLRMLQPCINAIGYTLGAGDLQMGDSAKNKLITSSSITTAVFYVLSAVFTIVAAFLPAEWTFGRFKRTDDGSSKEAQ